MIDPAIGPELFPEVSTTVLEAWTDFFAEVKGERYLFRILFAAIIWRIVEAPLDRLWFRVTGLVAAWRQGKKPTPPLHGG